MNPWFWSLALGALAVLGMAIRTQPPVERYWMVSTVFLTALML